MASDWIRLNRGMRHNPKVVAMARYLSADRRFMNWWSDPIQMTCKDAVTELVTFANVTRVTVCALADVWSALNLTIGDDGRAPYMTLADLDDIAEIPSFGDAMESVGWVRADDSKGLVFPNFREHNTPSKSRGNAKSDAERARAYRERKKAKSSRVTKVTNVTVEKRREEKSNKNSSGKRKRERDAVWDSVQELFHPSGVPESQSGRIGKVVKELKALGALPEQIRQRYAAAKKSFPDKPFGPEVLVKHWDALETKQPKPARNTSAAAAIQRASKLPEDLQTTFRQSFPDKFAIISDELAAHRLLDKLETDE